MTNSYDHIMIDVMNMYWRAYSANKHLTTKLDDGTVLMTGGIYTSLKMIEKLRREYLSSEGIIYFLFEGSILSKQDLPLEVLDGARSYRKDLDPDYKSPKEERKIEPEFYRALDFLEMLLVNYDNNFVCIRVPDMEADDLVQPLISDISKEDSILLVSGDMDWARSISDNVDLLKKDKIINIDNFQEEFGIPYKKNSVEIYKAFRGDGSDNIPKGVSGIRETILIQLIEDFSSLKEIFDNLDEIDYLSDTWKSKILESKSRLRLNYRLVEFFPIEISYLKQFILNCEYNPRTLYEIYSMLGFNVESMNPKIIEDLHVVEKNEQGFFEHEKTSRV